MNNPLLQRLVKREIENVDDNLYRYRIQVRNIPDWKTGNGILGTDIIASLEAEIVKLKETLKEVE